MLVTSKQHTGEDGFSQQIHSALVHQRKRLLKKAFYMGWKRTILSALVILISEEREFGGVLNFINNTTQVLLTAWIKFSPAALQCECYFSSCVHLFKLVCFCLVLVPVCVFPVGERQGPHRQNAVNIVSNPGMPLLFTSRQEPSHWILNRKNKHKIQTLLDLHSYNHFIHLSMYLFKTTLLYFSDFEKFQITNIA